MLTHVRGLLTVASERLTAVSETPLLDAEVLMAHLLGRDRSWLYAWPEHQLDEAQLVDRAVGTREGARGVEEALPAAVDDHQVRHRVPRRCLGTDWAAA